MRIVRFLTVGAAMFSLTGACSNENAPEPAADYDARQAARTGAGAEDGPALTPDGAPSRDAAAPPGQPAFAMHALRGIVRETMDAGRYTYIFLETDQGAVWAAATQMNVSVGDTVELAGAMPMQNFHSKTLDRTFEEILFVGKATVVGAAPTTAPASPAAGVPAGHPPIGTVGEEAVPKASGSPAADVVEKLTDGYSVAELFERKDELAGKPVKFRGRVVKTNSGIMGRNWLHLQDGTGGPGGNDITVTSKTGYAEVGTVVVVEGTLGVDKDFGSGYTYAVIVEEATITLEATQPESTDAEPKTGDTGGAD